MYKSKLQELCHQRLWNLPEYTAAKNGPDHNPRFQATVTVNSISFTTPDFCNSSKEAQNDAARIALEHFSSSLPKPSLSGPSVSSASVYSSASTGKRNIREADQTPHVNAAASAVEDANRLRGYSNASTVQLNIQETNERPQLSANTAVVKDVDRLRDMQHLYKNQLQNYAQKRNLTLPTYSCMREGPPHASRFKCKVTFDGRTYESQEFFPTLKEAEHRAAKVALMSLSPDGIQEDDDSGLYKNLLQELAQKEGYALPVYNTTQSGVPHIPNFVSTVEVEQETFLGQEAKTKKLAEMNAAKVAYLTLKERKPNRGPMFPSPAHREQANDSSSNLQANVITDPHQNVRPSGGMVSNPSLIPLEQAEEDRVNVGFRSPYLPDPFPQPQMITTLKRDSSSSDPSASSMPENGTSPSPKPSGCPINFAVNPSIGLPGPTDTRTRIRVCPRVPNMTVPEGSKVMHSDGNWVALKLTSISSQ